MKLKLTSAAIFVTLFALGQTPEQLEKIRTATNTIALQEIAEKRQSKYTKEELAKLAEERGLDVKIETDSTYSELVRISENGEPIYYMTYNRGAGITSRANQLYEGGNLGLAVHGENMKLGIWDGGIVTPTHELFTNRVVVKEETDSHYHANHVAGTMIGTDQVLNGAARGMAFKSTIDSYKWDDDIAEIALAAADGLLISNHSYGYNPLFLTRNIFGKYVNDSRDIDEIMYNAPYYLNVKAAGNSRIIWHNYQREKDGYDMLTDMSTAKNNMVVGAVHEVLEYSGPSSVEMSTFSNWGPTDDGRIKPDITAKGVGTLSATDYYNNSYATLQGTSMASPSVAGTLMLLQQHYNNLNQQFMRSATLPGLTLDSTDEAGEHPGPVNLTFGKGQELLQTRDNIGNIIANGYGFTQAALFGGDIKFDWESLSLVWKWGLADEFYDQYTEASGFSPFTITGNTNVTSLLEHESIHVWQSRAMFRSFGPNFILEGIHSLLLNKGFKVSEGYPSFVSPTGNWFETMAESISGY